MSQRTTDRELDNLARLLNIALERPESHSRRSEVGVVEGWNEGHLYIDRAYGACALFELHADSSVSEIISRGTKRELADAMRAMMRGIDMERKRG